jgi:hypothetical protein
MLLYDRNVCNLLNSDKTSCKRNALCITSAGIIKNVLPLLNYERKSKSFTTTPRGDGPPILANLSGNLGTLY